MSEAEDAMKGVEQSFLDFNDARVNMTEAAAEMEKTVKELQQKVAAASKVTSDKMFRLTGSVLEAAEMSPFELIAYPAFFPMMVDIMMNDTISRYNMMKLGSTFPSQKDIGDSVIIDSLNTSLHNAGLRWGVVFENVKDESPRLNLSLKIHGGLLLGEVAEDGRESDTLMSFLDAVEKFQEKALDIGVALPIALSIAETLSSDDTINCAILADGTWGDLDTGRIFENIWEVIEEFEQLTE